MDRLSPSFTEELLKAAFTDKEVLDVLSEHFEYTYLPPEQIIPRRLFKAVLDYYRVHQKVPTMGIISQQPILQRVEGVNNYLVRVMDVTVPSTDDLMMGLETYIKSNMFQACYYRVAELYNEKSVGEAVRYQAEESQRILDFSLLKDTNYLSSVLGGYEKRCAERRAEGEAVKKKIPFGIEALDVITEGGIDAAAGDTCCLVARSGAGKTKFLRHIGVEAMRRGYSVLHFQAEGSLKECLDGYDAHWTGYNEYELHQQEGDLEKESKVRKTLRLLKQRGAEIEVKAYEQFNAASMVDVRKTIQEYYKIKKKYPDVITLDYLELFDPGDGKRYDATVMGEKMRRENSARKLKNLCMEFKMAGFTATQCNDVFVKDKEDESFVITRNNVSAAKGIPDSFSALLSLNVSSREYEKEEARIYVDKMRKHKGGQTIKIATSYKNGRFVDIKRTRVVESEYKKELIQRENGKKRNANKRVSTERTGLEGVDE
jgi:hypothetical protein